MTQAAENFIYFNFFYCQWGSPTPLSQPQAADESYSYVDDPDAEREIHLGNLLHVVEILSFMMARMSALDIPN
jgi:hypothetical protein